MSSVYCVLVSFLAFTRSLLPGPLVPGDVFRYGVSQYHHLPSSPSEIQHARLVLMTDTIFLHPFSPVTFALNQY